MFSTFLRLTTIVAILIASVIIRSIHISGASACSLVKKALNFQEKEHLEMQQRVTERELSELRDKLMATNRSLGLASSNIASQEATISTLRSKQIRSVVFMISTKV